MQYQVGDRVEISPSCDLWMMGARYGEVVKVGRKLIHVKLDRTGKVHKFTEDLIYQKV